MKKFRVISDLHLDINRNYPLTIDDDVFTVICGDTSGHPSQTIEWISKNIKAGVGVSGNHLPYNDDNSTIQELREKLADAFPLTSSFTYLDAETDVFCKEVDGILFIGSCMYTDMHVKHARWNPNGDPKVNMAGSQYNMNDYYWGIKSKSYPAGKDSDFIIKHITAEDYMHWFENAYSKIEAKLNENEKSASPMPVVLITHHPLITDFVKHNFYIEDPDTAWRQSDYNLASYVSDMKDWLLKHASIKCYCCGHIHAVDKEWRSFNITREDGSKILIVNNARGYSMRLHDSNFNKNTFVNVETWNVEVEKTE